MCRPFDDIIKRQSARVFRLLFSFVKNREDAQDLMQDVFLRYFERPVSFETEEHERAWFLKVAANTAKSHLRKAALRRHEDVDELPLSAPETDPCLRLTVTSAVAALPAKQRICVHLFYYENLKQNEIAAILSCPVSTVKSHLRRAKAALLETLGGTL
ncbi:MAG: RNA polymerase sigma factor [Clostridia bacterium]|nr:RNA polymerase sigma factor [Clostridia bacterium]